MSVIIFVVAFLVLLQQPAEGRQCRHPRPLRHGRYEYQRSGYYGASRLPEGSVVRVICRLNARRFGDEYIVCQDNGKWSSRSFCREILCRPPTLELIEHGTSNIVDRDYKIGEEVHYTCDIGYRLDGRSWQVCREIDGPNGMWTERVPRCQVVQCPDPGQLHLDNDGQVSFSSLDRNIGTVMNLRCSSRLTLLGSSERVCQPNGLWNGTLTSCDSIEYYCPALGNPIHGSKVVPYNFNLNSVVRFRCDPGTNDKGDPLFELVGSHERRCTVTGEWSGEMPRCMARDEFDDMDRVTAVMGETFDELEIDGSYLSRQRDHDHRISSTLRKKRFIDLNNERGLDIIFAFDGSGSIGNESFSKGKEFAKLLVKKVFVSLNPGGARVGVLVYATKAEIIFHVNEYNDTASVVNAIEARVQHKNKGTNLPEALFRIRTEMLPIAQQLAHQNRRVLFLITDGVNNMGGEPIKDVLFFIELEVAIHCIGVSQDVSKEALNSIASEPKAEHIFFLRDYLELEHAVNDVTSTNRSYDKCGVAGHKSATPGKVRRGRWPWQAAIYSINPNGEEKFGCGGSLIDRQWVLTAAHCIINRTKREVAVYLGLTIRDADRQSSRSQRFDVIEMVIHPEYHDDGTYFNDIALLRLDHEAQLNIYVRTICLPPDLDLARNRAWTLLKPGNMARMIGWGRPGSSAELPFSNTLKEIVLPLVSGRTCKEVLEQYDGIGEIKTDIQFCAGFDNGTTLVKIPDACEGDSGGPLMVEAKQKFVVVGIVSFGVECGKTYGVYTKVPRFVGWIQMITGPPSCPVPTALPERLTATLRTGHLVDALYTEQSVLRYSCVDGYFPSSDVNITCQLGGAWISDGEVPECIEILCRPPTLELIEHGTSNIVDRDYKIGEEAHYTCDLGYRLDGRSWQVCREGDGPIGVWTERVPRCRVVQCPDPGPLHLDSDGHVSFSSPDRRIGTIMTLSCSSRLTLLGSSERVCQPNGLWNGTLTSCDSEENYCPALGNPIHGTKVVPYSFNLNSVVRFRCDTGTDDNGDPLFELVGSHERMCTESGAGSGEGSGEGSGAGSGEWSGEMPRCVARDEFDDMDRVTAVMGETFDELAIDGSYLSRQYDHDHRISSTSRRKRSIDLNNERGGLDIIFAFDGSGSIGNESFSKGKEFAKLLVQKPGLC